MKDELRKLIQQACIECRHLPPLDEEALRQMNLDLTKTIFYICDQCVEDLITKYADSSLFHP